MRVCVFGNAVGWDLQFMYLFNARCTVLFVCSAQSTFHILSLSKNLFYSRAANNDFFLLFLFNDIINVSAGGLDDNILL